VAALQLSLALLPLAALAFRTPTCVGALHSSSTGGQPSGSDRFRVFGSTGCKPPTRIGCSALPFDLRRSIKLAPDDPGFIGLAPDNPGSIQLAPYGPSSG
jgi:hypothetical protein